MIKSLLVFLILGWGVTTSNACNLASVNVDYGINNGNGTYTYAVTVCLAVDVNWGATTAFNLSVDGANIVSTSGTWYSTYQYCDAVCGFMGGCTGNLFTGGGNASGSVVGGNVIFQGCDGPGLWLAPDDLDATCIVQPQRVCDQITITTDTLITALTGTWDEGTFTCISLAPNIPVLNACTPPIASFDDGPNCNGVGFDFTNTGSVGGGMGAPGFTYAWTFDMGTPSVSTAESPTGILWGTVGTYNVTLITCQADNFTCCDTITQSITTNGGALMTVSLTTIDASCGNADGSVSAGVTGGVAPFTYQWDDPGVQTTATASGLAATGYNLLVTDSNGCTANESTNVSDAGAAVVTIVSSSDVTCNGGNDGSIQATATGGAPPLTYLWNDLSGQTTATAVSLTAGVYTLSVTDTNGCTGTTFATISESPPMIINSTVVNLSCNGICDGSATAMVSGGTPPYAYLWDDPGAQTNATATGLCVGTYSVVITDSSACLSSETIIIIQPLVLTLSTSVINSSCDTMGGTVSICASGGTVPYTYLWNDSGAQTTKAATGLANGSYTVVVTDAGSCVSNATDSVNNTGVPPSVTITSSIDVSCNGGNDGLATAAVTGGTAPYTYLWDDLSAQTNPFAAGLIAGIYTVSASDAAGCLSSVTVTLNEPSVLTLTMNSTNTTCGNDGSALVTVTGGTGSYAYLWNDSLAQTMANAVALSTGPYTATVTDANGCTDSAIVAVLGSSGGTASILSITNVSCTGVCDGSATATISGGTAPYVYLWDDPAMQTNAQATGLCTGSYTATVTDDNGCTTFVSATLNVGVGMTISITSFDASCGNADGSLSAGVTGGAAPLTYQWDDPGIQTSATASGLAATGYNLLVTDSNGCTANESTSVSDTGAAVVTIVSSSDVSCNGGNDGSIQATAAGGAPPLTYLWSDLSAQTTATAVGLTAGVYTVSVTDTNGCTGTTAATISESTPVIINTSVVNLACYAICDGSATAMVSGGTAPYAYLWDDPGAQTNATATGLCAGTYSIVITDGNACVSNVIVMITSPPMLSLITSTTVATCGTLDGSVTATVIGGIAPYGYLWNDPAGQTTVTATGLAAGFYTVVVTDAGGCVSNATDSVTGTGIPVASITGSIDVSCNGGNDGLATVAVTGGAAPYAYLWDDLSAQTNPSATGLIAGIYTVSVSDTAGCLSSATVTVNEPPPLTLAMNSTSSTCGANNGSVLVTVTGGTGGYAYLWNDSLAQTTANAVALSAGSYTVTVTDANGCTSSAFVTVLDIGGGIASIVSSTDASCAAICNGTAMAAITGGTAPYLYLWDDPASQTNALATGLCAGSYAATVTDDNGCISSAAVTINVDPDMIVVISSTSSSCGANNGSASATVSGGVAPFIYLWDDPATQTTATASGLAAAVYVLMVTDSNGCSASQSININDDSGASVTIISSNNVTCNGGNDGFALSSSTGGTPPLTYLWDDPANQNTLNAIGLAPGSYTVSVTDSLGCTNISDSVIITEPTALLVSSTHVDATGGVCNGNITAITSGATVPYTFLWDDSLSQTTQTAIALCAGSYTVTVTDNNNCVATKADTVSVITGIAALLEDGDVSIYPNPTEDLIWIDNSEYAGNWGLKLYDFTGKMVINIANLKTSPFV
ncbi:MAG: hypothetical protein JKY52_07675, partial [Flavobacteriales bacterium]|nr:hypothetical protein [Flavobacteriales bacterium]